MPNKFDRNQIASKIGWSNAFIPNAAFPLDIRQYFGSLEDAQAAAATAVQFGSTESPYYYGMQVFVFDGTKAEAYLIQGDKTLQKIGSDVAPEIPELNWKGTTTPVNFYALTRAQYTALESKDEGTLYFISDESAIYRGEVNYSDEIEPTTSVPEVAAAQPRKIYLDLNSLEIKVTIDNINWIVASPGYLTDGANWATADSGKLATIGLIKKAIQDATAGLGDIAFASDTGIISTTGDKSATLTGVAHNPTYDGTVQKITIPVYGGEPVVISLPQSQTISDIRYNETTGNLEFYISGQENPIEIPAADLFKQLEADNTGRTVTLTIAEGKISADVKIDPVEGNMASISAAGLKVDGSGKMDKLSGTASDAGKIAIIGEDGTTIAIGTYTIPELLANASAKVEGAVENNVASFNADGTLKDSGKTIGGATIAATPDSNTLATEAAVKTAAEEAVHAALAWKPISN